MKAINECVCITLDGCDTPITRGQNEPYDLQCKHALLFAAAEDMLEALQMVQDSTAVLNHLDSEAQQFIRNSIKKALGQA